MSCLINPLGQIFLPTVRCRAAPVPKQNVLSDDALYLLAGYHREKTPVIDSYKPIGVTVYTEKARRLSTFQLMVEATFSVERNDH